MLKIEKYRWMSLQPQEIWLHIPSFRVKTLPIKATINMQMYLFSTDLFIELAGYLLEM